MRFKINGEDREFPGGLSIAALLERLELDLRKIAVERNLEIVPRSEYKRTLLSEGDNIEIVNFVGGG